MLDDYDDLNRLYSSAKGMGSGRADEEHDARWCERRWRGQRTVHERTAADVVPQPVANARWAHFRMGYDANATQSTTNLNKPILI
jgi:hypothetical protein